MLRTDTINTKADDELREQVQNSGNNEVDTKTEETTTTPPTVVTPSVGTTTEPFFNRQQQVALTLMPLASALLQGKTQGGQSQLSGLLAAAGQGLAGSTNVALQLAQLEDARKKTSTTASKQYVLQEGFEGKVDVGGKQYSKEDNIIFNFTPEQVNAFPQGTFVEYTKPKTDKATSKEMFVVKDFEIDGVKYEMAGNNINGVLTHLTEAEAKAKAEKEKAWNDNALSRALTNVRITRNRLLAETDFYALGDVTMSNDMKTYRQELRDITNGLDTVEKCNAVTWPTKP